MAVYFQDDFSTAGTLATTTPETGTWTEDGSLTLAEYVVANGALTFPNIYASGSLIGILDGTPGPDYRFDVSFKSMDANVSSSANILYDAINGYELGVVMFSSPGGDVYVSLSKYDSGGQADLIELPSKIVPIDDDVEVSVAYVSGVWELFVDGISIGTDSYVPFIGGVVAPRLGFYTSTANYFQFSRVFISDGEAPSVPSVEPIEFWTETQGVRQE